MNTNKLRPCMEKLLESKDHLRHSSYEQLKSYLHLLTVDSHRAWHDRWESTLIVRQLYSTARPNETEWFSTKEADNHVTWAFEQEFLPMSCSQIRRKARFSCGKHDCPFVVIST